MTLYDDYFDDNTISGCWTESYTTLGSGVEYTLVVSGTISGAADRTYLRLYSGEGSVDAVSFSGSGVYQSTTDDFTITVKVSESSYLFVDTGTIQYHNIGIAAVVDSANYIYFYKSKQHTLFGYKYNIGGSGGSYSWATTDYRLPPYYLGITKSGTSYNLWYGMNDFELIPGPPFTLSTGTCNVWLFCNRPNPGSEIWADFEYFITVS
jgi:hypothetical protein